MLTTASPAGSATHSGSQPQTTTSKIAGRIEAELKESREREIAQLEWMPRNRFFRQPAHASPDVYIRQR